MRSKRTLSVLLAACLLLSLIPAGITTSRAASYPNPVYNHAAYPEVVIFNAANGNNGDFYQSVQGSSDFNAVEAGYFEDLRYSTTVTGQKLYQWKNFKNTTLNAIRQGSTDLKIGYSVTRTSKNHKHTSGLYKWNMTSYSDTALGFNTGGIAWGLITYTGYKSSQDTARYGNRSYSTWTPQDSPMDLAFNPNIIKYDDGKKVCSCGGSATGAMVCFYDGEAPEITGLSIKNQNGEYCRDFKPGDTVNIVITCSENVRFSDDSASGKGNLCIGFKLNGKDSSQNLYAHLTKLDGKELTFSYSVPADDTRLYEIVQIDLTASNTGMALISKSANIPLKMVRAGKTFTATKPGSAGENGITKTTSYVTDLAGNALYVWGGGEDSIPREIFIDCESPEVAAVDLSADTNNLDVREALGTAVGEYDPSDSYLGVGDTLYLKAYMSELTYEGTIYLTTNIKNPDGTYLEYSGYTGWGRSVNVKDVGLGTQYGLGASKGSVTLVSCGGAVIRDGMTIDDPEGKIKVTSVRYYNVKDKSGNTKNETVSKVYDPNQQYHLDTKAPIATADPVTQANRTDYGFRASFQVEDVEPGSGVTGIPGYVTLGGGVLTGKFQYAVTGAPAPDDKTVWLDGSEGVALPFKQSGGQQYLHVKKLDGELYDISKLIFTLSDYAGNRATTTEVSVTGVGFDSMGPTPSPGNTTRSYDNAGFGTMNATVTVSDPSGVTGVQYQWNDGTELTAESTGWIDAVGTLGETSVNMTVSATVPSGEAFRQTLWIKAQDEPGNVSVTSLGEYSYNLAGIHYCLEYSTAVTSMLSLELTSKDADGVVVFDVQKKNDDTHYIQIYNQYRPTSGNIFAYQTFYTADFDDSDGFKFTNLTDVGNTVLTRWMDYTGDMTVTVYSGVVGKTDEHGTTGDIFRSGSDPTADIIMTTNTKTETVVLHYSYAYNWEHDVFSQIYFHPVGDSGVGALTGPWTYNPNYNYARSYSVSTLEGLQVHLDLGEDINGWNFSDIDWENSFIAMDLSGTVEEYKLCGIGFGPEQTITLPASDRYTDGYHHITVELLRRSWTPGGHKYYSNGFNAYVDTTEPGTLELGILGKYDNYLGEYSSIPYDPSETIYIPTQQCNTFLSVDVLDPDGTPHEMQYLAENQKIGELSVIAWNVAEPDKIVNLERSYLVEENGVIRKSDEGTGTNSKRLLYFDLGTEDTNDDTHTLGLALEQDSVIALQVRYANGRYSEITYLTVHPISIGKGGTATAIPYEVGDWPTDDIHYGGVVTADPGKAAVIFTPYEGENFTGLKVYCQEAYETHWAYDTYYSPYLYTQAFTPLPGTEPIELEQQADGTYVYYPEATDGKTTGIIRVADDGTVTNALADDRLAQGFYCFWAEDQYGNRDSMAITEYGVIPDGAAPVVTEKSLTTEGGCYTATFKIYDDSLFTTFKSTNTWPVFDVDPPRPMTLTLSYDNAYSAVVGTTESLTLENVWNDFSWKNSESNTMGIYEVTAELTQTGAFDAYDYGDTYDGFPTEAYLTVTVKGVIGPDANNAEMTLNLTATDAHGNVAEPVGVTGTVTGVEPAVTEAVYQRIEPDSDYNYDRALYLTFNVPVQPEESWINRSIEGWDTEWHDAFPIWKDGEWTISYTDVFGTRYDKPLTLTDVIGDYGFDLSFSTLDYVAAAEGVTVNYVADADDEMVTYDGHYGSYTFTKNGDYYLTREGGGDKDLLPIHLNNIVSGGPDETLYFYLDEFKTQYIAGSAEQYQGTTTAPVTVSYRTGRDTSPVGETTLTFKNGDNDTFSFQYYDAATDFTYTISGKLSDYGITLAAPSEPYRDEEAPLIDLVTVWKQRAGGFVEMDAFPGSADDATVTAAVTAAGTAQSYDFVVKATDYSKWKVVVKSAAPTEMSYASAANDPIAGVTVQGNNVLVTPEAAADFWIVVVDNATGDSAATADNFSCVKIPFGSYCFDTTAPVIETLTVDEGMYSKAVYIKVTDYDNQGNLTTGVSVSGVGVLDNSDPAYAEYPYKLIFTENDATVVVTATDAAGNSATTNVKVTGIDTSSPTLSTTWSPCYQDPVTGQRDTANPTTGPVNTAVVAHITSDKPIVRVEASCFNGYYTDVYDFDNPSSEFGTIEYSSQRITVRFEQSWSDYTVYVTAYAPNGKGTTARLHLKEGVIDQEAPHMYVDDVWDSYLYREGYSVPYGLVLKIRPTGDDKVRCTNYGSPDELYYQGDEIKYFTVTVTDASKQVFTFMDEAGNLTRVQVPAPDDDFMSGAPRLDELEILDSVAPTLSISYDEDASATNTAVTAAVTVNEECTLFCDDPHVTLGTLTATTDSEGNEIWTGTVSADANGTFLVKAFDLAGNESSVRFTVHNVDRTLPVIGFVTSTVKLRQDSTATELSALLNEGVTAWDNVAIKDGSLAFDTSGVLLDVAGVYAVTYTVEDAVGNVGRAIRYVKVLDKNQLSVTVDDVLTEADSVTSIKVGRHVLTVDGLKTANEPYKVQLVKGLRSAGQMKRVSTGITIGADGSFTVPSAGYYTLYIITQSRQTYRLLLDVEN